MLEGERELGRAADAHLVGAGSGSESHWISTPVRGRLRSSGPFVSGRGRSHDEGISLDERQSAGRQAGGGHRRCGGSGEAAELHGGEIRFFLAGVAGEEVNGTVFAIEYESPEALATASDALADNIELQAFLNRMNAPGSRS